MRIVRALVLDPHIKTKRDALAARDEIELRFIGLPMGLRGQRASAMQHRCTKVQAAVRDESASKTIGGK